MHLGIGSRAYSMGKAQVAVTSGVEAAYWNPARMHYMQKKNELSIMHASYFAGIANFDFAGIAHRIDSASAFAVTAIRMGVDDIPDTRYLYDANGRINYDNIRFFNAVDVGIFATYSRQLFDGFSAGISAKLIRRTVGPFANAWGVGIDAAINYTIDLWTFSGVIRDVTTTYTQWTHNVRELQEIFALTGNELRPQSEEITLPRLILGASRTFKFDNISVLPTLDIELTSDGERNTLISTNIISMDPRVGVEAGYRDLVYLRAGVFNIQQVDFAGAWSVDGTLGGGLALDWLRLDYALSNFTEAGQGGLFSHVFSLIFPFNTLKQ